MVGLNGEMQIYNWWHIKSLLVGTVYSSQLWEKHVDAAVLNQHIGERKGS